VALVLVFFTGISMAPVFPTTLAIVGDAFPPHDRSAIGFVNYCGWRAWPMSSRIIE